MENEEQLNRIEAMLQVVIENQAYILGTMYDPTVTTNDQQMQKGRTMFHLKTLKADISLKSEKDNLLKWISQ